MAKTYYNPATGRQTTIAPSGSSTSTVNTSQKVITDSSGKQVLNPNYVSPQQQTQQSGGTSQLLENQGSAVIKVKRSDGGYDYYANPDVLERENIKPAETPQQTYQTVITASKSRPTVRVSEVDTSGSSRVLSREELNAEYQAAEVGKVTNEYKRPETIRNLQSAQQSTVERQGQQQVKSFSVVQAPFFSIQGQKQRITNAALVTAEAVTSPYYAVKDYYIERKTGVKQPDYKIRADTGSKVLNRGSEAIANNPYETAFYVTGGVYAVRGVSGLVAGRTAGTATAGTATAGTATAGTTTAGTATAGTATTDAVLTQTAAQGAKIATKNVAANFARGAGAFGVDLVKTGAVGYTTYQTGVVGADLATTKENRDIIFDDKFEIAVQRGYQAEEQALSKSQWYNRAANQIPIVSIWAGNKQSYKQGAKEYYLSQGFTEEQADKAASVALRERTVRSAALGASFLTTSASTELIGSKYVSTAFKDLGAKGVALEQAKSGGKVFLTSFKSIGKAGVIEGSVQQSLQDYSRTGDINIKNTAIAGGVGGITAGVIGGGIATFAVKQQGGRQAALQGFSYVTDPYEYPGDKLADFVRYGYSKVTKRTLEQPQVFSSRLGGVPVITFTPTMVPVNANTPVLTNTQVNINTPSNIRTNTAINIPSIEIPTKDNLGTFIFTPAKPIPSTPIFPNTPINPDIPINPNVPVNPEVPIQPQIPINPNVPIFTNTPINVPVITPMGRIPPPFLPSVPTGGGSGRSGGQGKRYVNELQAAFGLFGVSNTTAPVKKAKKNTQFSNLKQTLSKQGYNVKITKKKGKK